MEQIKIGDFNITYKKDDVFINTYTFSFINNISRRKVEFCIHQKSINAIHEFLLSDKKSIEIDVLSASIDGFFTDDMIISIHKILSNILSISINGNIFVTTNDSINSLMLLFPESNKSETKQEIVKEKEYTYYVSYYYTYYIGGGKEDTSFGCSYIKIPHKIRTIGDTMKMMEEIKNKNNYTKVIILNFIELEE